MTLEKYWKKRDFAQTSEPRGEVGKAHKKLSYFIQKHAARRLHYDFRLELEGTLKSWAIPKGPSLDPADKRLAVHVEDHPISYGTFEGEIPPHQYGAGTVLLWDRGTWTCEGDPVAAYRKGYLKIHLDGEKLSGGWALVRMGPAKEEKENWLLIKERDEYAATGKDANIVALRPESVAKPARENAHKNSDSVAAPVELERLGAIKAPMPEIMKPQLAVSVDSSPRGPDWLAEVKFDGYRALCRIEQGAAKIFTRAGNDWTTKWQHIASAVLQLPVRQAWVDGEVVAIDQNGAISFQLLQSMERFGHPGRLFYYLFDVMYLDGYDLTNVPLIERKKLLKKLLAGVGTESPLLYSDHLSLESGDLFKQACAHGMEGIIAKRADAHYRQGRGTAWLKLKCQQRQEFVIGGYTDPTGSRERFGALLLGVYDDQGRFHYAGRVGTGFDAAMLERIANNFQKNALEAAPFSEPLTGVNVHGVHWLKPELVAEVKFSEWTNDNVVRHPAFIGLRTDKPAKEIRRELVFHQPDENTEIDQGVNRANRKRRAKNSLSRKEESSSSTVDASRHIALSVEKEGVIAGVKLSHPLRILYADIGLTKFRLAQYYQRIAKWILPHLAQRPLMLVRCPQGSEGQCFHQKNANDIGSDIETVEVPSSDGTATYMMVNSLKALIGLVQMNVLELHTWGAKKDRLYTPDRIIFDLDPAPDLSWGQVIEGAQLTKALLDQIDLRSFVKTTGGKGLHIVIPINPEKPWEEVKAFSRAIAEHLADTFPDRFTANMSKAKRTGKIFIDYLRNDMDATAIAAYSTRVHPGAPISVPLTWDELMTAEMRTLSIGDVEDRLEHLTRDPWRDYFTSRQSVTERMLRIFNSD